MTQTDPWEKWSRLQYAARQPVRCRAVKEVVSKSEENKEVLTRVREL